MIFSTETFNWLSFLLLSLLIIKVIQSYLQLSLYWFNRGVTTKFYFPFIGSNWNVLFGLKSKSDSQLSTYLKFKDKPYYGCILSCQPVLAVREPAIIKKILLKNFDHFTDHKAFKEKVDPIFSKNLFSLTGKVWKNVRSTINPIFQTSKMKIMFHLVDECAKEIIENCEEKYPNDQSMDLEMEDFFSRFTLNVIAVTAFGMELDQIKNSNIFHQMSRNFVKFSSFRMILVIFMERLMVLLGEGLIPNKINSFFKNLVTNTLKYREQKNIVRPDLLHLLMMTRKNKFTNNDNIELEDNQFAVVDDVTLSTESRENIMELTDDEITAQVMVFILAGVETSSSTLSFTCYELAMNPTIQDGLRQEIDDTRKKLTDNQITYETLSQMKYLDMVVSETLRKYPPVSNLNRMCTSDFLLENDTNSFIIEKNILVMVPTHCIHHDPKFYPDPKKYDTERFSNENRKRIVPYTYLPFGLGPRACIGLRFALMEIKILLFHLLSQYLIEPNADTPPSIKFKKSLVSLSKADNGISLRFVSRKEHNH